MKILLNALGIQDSGGITILNKILNECTNNNSHSYYIVVYKHKNTNQLLEKYKSTNNFEFNTLEKRNFLYRFYYENIYFKTVVDHKQIDLIYNFTGSTQLLLKTPQLIKIHNLLFYSKKLDFIYKRNHNPLLWFKHILLKRFFFKTMLRQAKYLEVQSFHVEKCLSDYIKTTNKKCYIKSDIEILESSFKQPKEYNFSKKIKFLYIVGPHFEYPHKNFNDFIQCMVLLYKHKFTFEINITLTKEELDNSVLWDNSLNNNTNFLGYISDEKKIKELFSENTILISTSVIETIGLHVVEGIKNGIITIAPDEDYSKAVYGKNILTYKLFDSKSLLNLIVSIIKTPFNTKSYILTLQNDLKETENNKYKSIIDIFEKVVNVQK